MESDVELYSGKERKGRSRELKGSCLFVFFFFDFALILVVVVHVLFSGRDTSHMQRDPSPNPQLQGRKCLRIHNPQIMRYHPPKKVGKKRMPLKMHRGVESMKETTAIELEHPGMVGLRIRLEKVRISRVSSCF